MTWYLTSLVKPGISHEVVIPETHPAIEITFLIRNPVYPDDHAYAFAARDASNVVVARRYTAQGSGRGETYSETIVLRKFDSSNFVAGEIYIVSVDAPYHNEPGAGVLVEASGFTVAMSDAAAS